MLSNLTNLEFRYALQKNKIILITDITLIDGIFHSASFVKMPDGSRNSGDKIIEFLDQYDKQVEYVEEVLEFINGLSVFEIKYVFYKYIKCLNNQKLKKLISYKKGYLYQLEVSILNKFKQHFVQK